jgi:hypothetical protein
VINLQTCDVLLQGRAHTVAEQIKLAIRMVLDDPHFSHNLVIPEPGHFRLQKISLGVVEPGCEVEIKSQLDLRSSSS